MSERARYALAATLGAALFGAHVLGFPTLIDRVGGDGLQIRSEAPRIGDTLDMSGTWPEHLGDRVKVEVRPGGLSADGPGMHRIEWSVRYRGGFERRVGRTQLTGPFQDLAAPPCALRLVLGQRFLDGIDHGQRRSNSQKSVRKGAPGRLDDLLETLIDEPQPGSLAHLIASMVQEQMDDFDQWPIGEFRGIGGVRMRWVRTEDIDDGKLRAAIALAGQKAAAKTPVGGVLRTLLSLKFEDGNVPVWISIVPVIGPSGLSLSANVRAEVDLDSWFYQWIADLFDGDDLATSTAKNELDYALASALGLPPPIELGRGHRLRFAYCDSEPIDVVTGRYAAIPIRLVHETTTGSAPILFGPAVRDRPLDMPAPMAIEFELDAMNGILNELWRSGFLDQALAELSLAERFNQDPLVRELLSVRILDVKLAMPPTLWQSARPSPDLFLGVEADIAISDRGQVTPAHLFGAVGIGFRTGASDTPLVAELTLSELSLTCEPEPGLLTPCYNDLVQAFRDRAGDIHGELSQRFTALYNRIVVGRRIDLQQASLRIEDAAVGTTAHRPTAVVRVDLFGRLQPGQ